MLAIRIVALALIVAGFAGMTYAGFDDLGARQAMAPRAEHAMREPLNIDVPMWTGVGGLLLGGMMLVGFASRR